MPPAGVPLSAPTVADARSDAPGHLQLGEFHRGPQLDLGHQAVQPRISRQARALVQPAGDGAQLLRCDAATEKRRLQSVETIEKVVAALGRAPPPLLGCIGLGLEKQDRVQPGQRRGGCRRTGPRPGSRGRTEAEAGAPSGFRGAATPPALWIGWRVSTRMIRFALLQAPPRRTRNSAPRVKRG